MIQVRGAQPMAQRRAPAARGVPGACIRLTNVGHQTIARVLKLQAVSMRTMRI
jgi:hypothetical protein